MSEIKLELLTAVVNQIKLDSEYGDFTAIEELFLKLENPEEQLKGFLADDLSPKTYKVKATQYVYWDAYVTARSPEEAYEKAQRNDTRWVYFDQTGQEEWQIYGDSIEEVEDGKN